MNHAWDQYDFSDWERTCSGAAPEVELLSQAYSPRLSPSRGTLSMNIADVKLAVALKHRFDEIGLPTEFHECIIAQLLNGYGLFSDTNSNFVLLHQNQTVQDGVSLLHLAYPTANPT